MKSIICFFRQHKWKKLITRYSPVTYKKVGQVDVCERCNKRKEETF